MDLYEASGKEDYVSWAIRLQEKQDELFYDQERGGYFVSAPDEHIIVRMKDVQVCFETGHILLVLMLNLRILRTVRNLVLHL